MAKNTSAGAYVAAGGSTRNKKKQKDTKKEIEQRKARERLLKQQAELKRKQEKEKTEASQKYVAAGNAARSTRAKQTAKNSASAPRQGWIKDSSGNITTQAQKTKTRDTSAGAYVAAGSGPITTPRLTAPDVTKITQYAPGTVESIASFSRLTPEEKLAAGWAGGGGKTWEPEMTLPSAPGSYLPGAAPDQTKALADMTEQAAAGKKAKDWANYTNQLGTRRNRTADSGTQAARDLINRQYDESIKAGQAEADRQFYEDNEALYRAEQEAMALYGNLPAEALEKVAEDAIAAGNEYNALVSGNKRKQDEVENIRIEKTQVNDLFKLGDIAQEISQAQETPERFRAIVEAGKQAEDNHYEKAYNDDNLLNGLAQNGTPEQRKIAAMIGGGDLLAGTFIRKEAFMTEEERDTINYYYGIGAPEEADAFYRLIERDLDKRKSDFLTENRAAYMKENDSGWMRAYETGSNISSGIAGNFGMLGETIGQKIQNEVTGEHRNVNMYGISGTLKRNEEITREALVEGLPPEMAALVDMGLGIGKTLPVLAAGPAAAPALMGAQTAGDTMYGAGKRGGNVNQMLQAGAISGAVDAAMSAIPAQAFYKLAGSAPESAEAFARGVLKQAGLAATDAGVSSYAQTLADLYVMGENSYYEQYRMGLMANGMSEAEATREANMEFFVREPVMEMALGAGGGAIMGSAAQALEIMTHRFRNSKLKAAQEKIWEEFVRETNRMTAQERGTSTPLLDELLGKEVMDEITGRTGGVTYGPGMEYVTPEGMRFSGGEVEQTTPGMAFSKGGNGDSQFPQGYSLPELIQDNSEWYEVGDNGDIMISDSAYITAKEGGKHYGKYADALKWKDNQVNKAYNSYVYQVELHHDKIAHPEKYIEDWNQKLLKEQLGYLKKWKKDAMRNAQEASIMQGILRERGVTK
ncbi:hypothetical protein [Christensenella tenuis]|jgi:hypothetical protein|uniref:Uncharacterized protein n=1 Tax=Christensenella tenuis TaxID=2763033 RepID=A0ABR7EF27_9FIRM|nr:hypothetical protein [Christensenella tenuis]MBC5648263.1 hypothetical protein [Christensenella tenuis]